MILAPHKLSEHLAQRLAPLYVVHGDAPLLVLEAADSIRAAARQQGFSERDTLVAGQGFRWDSLFLAAGNLSLFGGAKLIDLRIPNGKPGRDGGEALQRFARQPAPDTVALITLPELDWQVRKSSWFKALEEHGVMLELNAPEREHLPRWIAGRLARQQQQADDEGLAFIAEHVEGNLLAAHQEIQKLGLLYPPGPLRALDIQDAILNVARYTLDMLREAVLAGETARAMRILQGLRAEAAAPPLLLWALANDIRTLATLRQGVDNGQPLSALFKQERIFDDRRRRLLQQAVHRVKAASLAAGLLHAARLDRLIKGVADGDVWDEFAQLILRVVRP